jgi:hypothetical protein
MHCFFIKLKKKIRPGLALGSIKQQLMCGPTMLGLSTGFYFKNFFNGASKRVIRPKHFKKNSTSPASIGNTSFVQPRIRSLWRLENRGSLLFLPKTSFPIYFLPKIPRNHLIDLLELIHGH